MSNIIIIILTYLSLGGILQLWVGCHIQPNTIEYIVDYGKENGTDFRFIGWRVMK